MEKSVLVTGANGLFGAHVVRALNNAGYKVQILVRSNCNMLSLERCSYKRFVGEITNEADVKNAMLGCDYVVHVAANTNQKPGRETLQMQINYKATKLIVDQCIAQGVERLIYVSTVNCFTNGSLLNPGIEDSTFMPWLKDSGYAYSKFLAQQYVLDKVKKGLDAVVVAPTFLIGAYDAKPSSGKLTLMAWKNRLLFYPPGGKSFVDAALASQALVNALSQWENGQTYFLAGENLSYKAFYKKVAAVSRQRKILIPIPKGLIWLLGELGEFLNKTFKTRIALNRVNARLLSLENYFSGAKAEKELGLGKTDVSAAIKKTLEWFKDQGV